MNLVAERRRHDPPRRVLPVLVVIFALVEHEMLDEWLAIDALAQSAGAPDRLVRLDAGGMNNVKRDARLVGQHDRAIGRFAFDLGRTRERVALRPGYALRYVVLLQGGDDFAVLGVDERHRAELGAAGERSEHLLV